MVTYAYDEIYIIDCTIIILIILIIIFFGIAIIDAIQIWKEKEQEKGFKAGLEAAWKAASRIILIGKKFNLDYMEMFNCYTAEDLYKLLKEINNGK